MAEVWRWFHDEVLPYAIVLPVCFMLFLLLLPAFIRDPSSWRMDPEDEAELDRRAGWRLRDNDHA